LAAHAGQFRETLMGGVVEPARTEEPAMPDDHFVIMTVECPRCKTKQRVHVAARTGFAQMSACSRNSLSIGGAILSC